jgi:ABC-type lipoprotein release transport system permease subunit
LALVGSVIGVPAGVGVNGLLLNFLNSEGGNDTPPALYEVFTIWQLVAIPLAGVAIAMAAALLPGRWAARQPVAEVLQAE